MADPSFLRSETYINGEGVHPFLLKTVMKEEEDFQVGEIMCYDVCKLIFVSFIKLFYGDLKLQSDIGLSVI